MTELMPQCVGMDEMNGNPVIVLCVEMRNEETVGVVVLASKRAGARSRHM